MAIEKRVADLFKRVDQQLKRLNSRPQPKTIHQFRTSAGRIETLLSEAASRLDRREGKALKLIAKLRRRAGKVRDLDVQIAALNSLKAPEQPILKTQVLQTLTEKRAKQEKRFLNLADKETVRELRRRLGKAEPAVREHLADPRIISGVLLNKFISHDGPVTEELLHRYRIEGKKIRYLAELTEDDPESRRLVDELKRLQDSLGDWHDWLTLDENVARLLPDKINSPLLAAIRNIRRAKYRDAVRAVTSARTNLLRKSPGLEQAASPKRLPAHAEAATAVA